MTDRVSVIIPCYRDSATLGRALNSVCAQTRTVDEIVVVNDCSPESEAIEAVLRDYPHVVYIRNAKNLGLAASRNVGLYAVTGEIVSFLDADDEIHPQKIELQYSYLGENQVIACDVEQVPNGRQPGHWRLYGGAKAKLFRGSRRLIYFNALTGASLMAPRRLLERVGGYDSTLRSCEDFDLWLRLAKEGVQIFNLQLPLYRYYFNPCGLSKNYFDISNWEIQVLLKHFSREGVCIGKSSWAARVWAFYVLKQMVRYEASGDERLASLINGNLAKLGKLSVWAGLLQLIRGAGLPKAYFRLAGHHRA